MGTETPVDPAALRDEVRNKYREVALNPHGEFHFHTGRPLAARLSKRAANVDALPDEAVESFAGVANPFSLRSLQPGARQARVGDSRRCVTAFRPMPAQSAADSWSKRNRNRVRYYLP